MLMLWEAYASFCPVDVKMAALALDVPTSMER